MLIPEKYKGFTYSHKFKNFDNMIDKFFELCEKNNILARKNWTCCNSCGNWDINNTNVENDKKFDAYIFYHIQETERILQTMTKDEYPIEINLAWGYFKDELEQTDPQGLNLGEQIKKLAKSLKLDLEYTTFNKKLILKYK